MKWREVAVLCAGMCVCTVIAARNPVQEETEVKSRMAGAVAAEAVMETETAAKAEAERHEVQEVGSGITDGTEILETEGGPEPEPIEETEEVTEEEVIPAENPEPESNLIIADVTNYVNIRSMPGEEGEILGKLYDDSVGRRFGEENGWFYIESGSVKGYVKADYVLTGEAAEIRAKEVGTRLAEVTTTTLKIRQEPSTDSIVLGLVPGGDILTVSEEVEGWVKVDVEDGPGYVSTDYVTVYTENEEAESREEEAARLKKEEEARKRAEAAAKAAQAQQQAANRPSNKPSSGNQAGSGGGNASGSSASESAGGLGQEIADYALRFLGNPYVYGGTSLTNGADCSGFVQSVYKHFGISLPRTSGEQGRVGTAVNGTENARPGDLVWYSGHIGIYIGNNKVVHASNPKNGIITSNVNYRTILGIRRIV